MKKCNKQTNEAILNEMKRIAKNLVEGELVKGQQQSMGYVVNKLACVMLGEISVKKFHKLIANTSEENKDYYVTLLGGEKCEKKSSKKDKKEKKEKKSDKKEAKVEPVKEVKKEQPKKVEAVKEEPKKEEPKTPKAKAEEKKATTNAPKSVNKSDDKS